MIGFGEHDASQFAISVAGLLLAGFGKSNVIKIEPNADHRGHAVGADGQVVFWKNADKSAIATITLMKSSASHRALLALYALDSNTPGGAGVGAFEMRDLVNDVVESSEKCAIRRRPDEEVAVEAGEAEWQIILAHWETSLAA